MAEQAKKLKKLGYNVRNLSIGEPDFYTQNFVLIAATKTIAEVILHAHYWVFCNSKLKPKVNVSSLEDLEVIVNICTNNNKIIILSAEISADQDNIIICLEFADKIVTLSVNYKYFALTVFSIVYGEGFSKVLNYIAQKADISFVENSTKNFINKMVNKFREKRKLLIKLLKEIYFTSFFKKKFKNVDKFVNFTKVSISTVSGSAFGTSKTKILEAFIRIHHLS